LTRGVDIVDLLVESGLAKSRSEARRTLDQRGIYVNDVQLAGTATLTSDDLLHDRYVMLRSGKKRRHLIVVEP
jgi:tyrosyl-tRNA synthetase